MKLRRRSITHLCRAAQTPWPSERHDYAVQVCLPLVIMLDTLTSYVPPPVVRRLAANPNMPSEPSSGHISAAVLYADISDFTPLVERLAERGAEGAEDMLSSVLREIGRHLPAESPHVPRIDENTSPKLWECPKNLGYHMTRNERGKSWRSHDTSRFIL